MSRVETLALLFICAALLTAGLPTCQTEPECLCRTQSKMMSLPVPWFVVRPGLLSSAPALPWACPLPWACMISSSNMSIPGPALVTPVLVTVFHLKILLGPLFIFFHLTPLNSVCVAGGLLQCLLSGRLELALLPPLWSVMAITSSTMYSSTQCSAFDAGMTPLNRDRQWD